MVAADIMTPSPITVSPRQRVYEALRCLNEEGIRHLPVVSEGELIGMLSDRDLRGMFVWDPDLNRFEAAAVNRLQMPVSEFLVGSPLIVNPETDVSEIIGLMLEQSVGALPVVDPHESELVGIISYVDVLKGVQDLA